MVYGLKSIEKNFAEKVTIKAGGAFKKFPRFALAHCSSNVKILPFAQYLLITIKLLYLPEVISDLANSLLWGFFGRFFPFISITHIFMHKSSVYQFWNMFPVSWRDFSWFILFNYILFPDNFLIFFWFFQDFPQFFPDFPRSFSGFLYWIFIVSFTE